MKKIECLCRLHFTKKADEFMWQQKIVSNLEAENELSNNKHKTWDNYISYSTEKKIQKNVYEREAK